MKALNIGLNTFLNTSEIMAIASPESAPLKRLIHDARDDGRLIDCSYGRKSRAVIRLRNGDVVLSGTQPSTLAQRWNELGG